MVTRRVPSVICKRAAISGRFLLTGGDCVRKSGLLANFPGKTGRGGEIRTHDLLYPKQARYQATLRPDEGGENAGGQVQLNPHFRSLKSPRDAFSFQWPATGDWCSVIRRPASEAESASLLRS